MGVYPPLIVAFSGEYKVVEKGTLEVQKDTRLIARNE
jgi:hypothetical protein